MKMKFMKGGQYAETKPYNGKMKWRWSETLSGLVSINCLISYYLTTLCQENNTNSVALPFCQDTTRRRRWQSFSINYGIMFYLYISKNDLSFDCDCSTLIVRFSFMMARVEIRISQKAAKWGLNLKLYFFYSKSNYNFNENTEFTCYKVYF